MDIRIRRRLNDVDDFFIGMIVSYYPAVSPISKTPINYGDWNSYRQSVLNSILRHALMSFITRDFLKEWDSKVEFELKQYVISKYTDRLYEEYKKSAYYIENEQY
jgi:hypothetical protein